ncbi:unnamed protein product [Phaedon cochleariae]|uniref:Zinc finger protein n=1 Tax=Phaedon cochleariae TaxID=80249 RepID=A0A9N9SI23_PHACE|nr:unnamed protein product [Phaedon cochleariae]
MVENFISTTLKLDKVCRVCLMEMQCDNLYSIYSRFEESNEEKIPAVHEVLMSISNIKVYPDESLPTMVCTECIEKAHSAYKFQQQCNKSQSLLDSYKGQINELKEAAVSISQAMKDNISLDIDEELTKMSNEDDVTGLNSVTNNIDDEHDCDDLKSCLPLGEDTIDELIKDNLQVENLEMISPKIAAFTLELSDEKINECPPLVPENISKEILNNMCYYKKDRGASRFEYECNICQKSFRSISGLRTHLKSHDEEKPYVCTECKKAFKVYGSLMHHIRTHSGEQPYECKECGKKYKQAGTLRAHMRIHTGSKPFLCTICGRGFRQAPDLTYHMRTHTKEKPYMCNVCGRRMSMQCHLVQHMRSHTGEKPFKCSECDKAFPSSTRLKRHSIVHTGAKPFECHLCHKRFNRSSGLRVHEKTHSAARSHACARCNKSFLWAHSLRAHLATHSEEQSDEKEVVVGGAKDIRTICSEISIE